MESGLHLGSSGLEKKVAQSDTLEKIGFEAQVTRGIQSVFKAQDDFLIWGPASVEIVDKEGDKISVEALDKALPQLLKRARLSLEHTDQIVGRILERFETEESVEIELNGQTYKREEFPTSVLDLDDGSPPALYVAGEIFNDTQQSKRAREQIEEGELTSYSISGEALVTRKQVEEGTVYDDVVDLDLSAVTLCQEGMNQGASYRKIEGEVSGKKLAGESADEDVEKHRNEVPVLQYPTIEGAGGQAEALGKSMTDSETDSEEKSTPSLEDVAKRLPEEGDIATKADVEEARTEAVEAFKENALPDGDLATVKYVEQLVDKKLEVSEKDVPEEVLDLADEHGLSPGAVVEILEAADDDEEDMEDEDELGDDDEDEEAEIEAGEDFEDEEDEEEFEDFEDEEDKEGPDFEDEEDEEGFDEEEDEESVSVEVLEENLPDDVWKVVSEYIELSSSSSEEKSEDESSDVSDDVAKEVEKILNGDVQGGTAIPTGDEDNQVDKQYSEGDDGDVPDRSPALAHWE